MAFLEAMALAAAPAAIGAGGGIISNLINQNQQENEATRNQSNFNTQMDNTIQRRVEDAKRAGIHPLYALGMGSGASSQPITINDQIGPSLQMAGQNMSSALARMQTVEEKTTQDLTNGLIRAQTRQAEAQAMLTDSERMRIMQAGQTGLGPQKANPNLPNGQVANPPGFIGPVQDVIDVKGSPVISGSSQAPGFLTGTNDYYQEWRIRPGFYLPLPRSEDEGPEETIQNMSPGAWHGMLGQGQEKYGGNWAQEMSDWRYKGIPPKGQYLSVHQQGPRRKSVYPGEFKGIARGEFDLLVDKAKKKLREWSKGGGVYEQDWLQKQYQDWRK